MTLAAGLAGGFVAAAMVPWPQTWRQFSDQYAFKVVEQVTLASELRGGREDDVRRRIEARLPEYVHVLNQNPDMRSSFGSVDPLCLIKSYYLKHQLPIPEEIRGILEEVPDIEFCPSG